MNKLNFLRKQFGHLPRQGTDEWLESRRTKIGGSEIAAAIGQSPYQKPKELVTAKNERKRLRAAACTFGRVFEPVAKEYIRDFWGHDLHEMGAIPSSRYPVCYSPDGVVVEGDDLVLAEIKCPFRRSKLQTVPPHYLCQVQTGMSILPCDRCYFYQFRFRLCSIEHLGPDPRYNRWLHFEFRKRCPSSKPLRWGYLHFPADTDLIDLGCVNKDTQDKICFVDRIRPIIHWETRDMPLEGYVMPFKLFDATLVPVPMDPTFLVNCGASLWNTHAELLMREPSKEPWKPANASANSEPGAPANSEPEGQPAKKKPDV